MEDGGPSGLELLRLLDQCDLSASRCSTPCISPSPSLLIGPGLLPLTARLKLGPLQSSMHSNASSSSGHGDAQAEHEAEVSVCLVPYFRDYKYKALLFFPTLTPAP